MVGRKVGLGIGLSPPTAKMIFSIVCLDPHPTLQDIPFKSCEHFIKIIIILVFGNQFYDLKLALVAD